MRMGITIHYKAKATEKQIDANTKYWLETVPKLKVGAPTTVFPDPGVAEIKRHDKIREGLTEEDMWNSVYATGHQRSGRLGWEEVPAEYGKTDYCKGVSIHQMDGCEWVGFRFCKTDKGWFMNSFTKTQYCGVPGHLLTCKILEEAKQKFFPTMTIYDEAGYCGDKDHHDMDTLKEGMEENAILIDQIGGMLKNAGWKDDQIISGGEMALKKSKEVV